MRVKELGLTILILSLVYLQNVSAQLTAAGTMRYVTIAADSSKKYSLYLPKDYLQHKEYPVIIFLDPGASGDYPVKKYKAIADKQNIILAGSLDSRNFDPVSSFTSVNIILNDISERVKVDSKNIWLSGFSGGARAASTYSVKDERITGLISCGASLSGDEFIASNRSVSFAGIVGYRDMNFEEMKRVSAALTKSNKDNLLLLFDDGHIWPPEEEINIAVDWLRKKSQLDNVILSRDIFHQIDSIRLSGSLYLSWIMTNEYLKVPALFKQADSVKELIEATKGFLKDKTTFENVLAEETVFLDEFSFLFGQSVFSEVEEVENVDTWKRRIETITLLQKNKNTYKNLSGARLFDFSWRLSIEQYNWLMSSRAYKQAYKAATILSFTNAFFLKSAFLMARAAAGNKDEKKCIRDLKMSIKKEKLTLENILNDGLITSLLDEMELNKLFNK